MLRLVAKGFSVDGVLKSNECAGCKKNRRDSLEHEAQEKLDSSVWVIHP